MGRPPGAYRSDTIAAIATPPGPGAIAIIRLSGVEAVAIAKAVLIGRTGQLVDLQSESHTVRLATVVDPATSRKIDEVIVIPMLAPRSFTGEDVVEIHCHGGSIAPRLVLAALLGAGARGARPGEFTERAFLNGKLDLCQAEAISDMVAASSLAGLEAARSQREGRLSLEIEGIREAVLSARALVEAHIDFPEDDLPPRAREDLLAAIEAAMSATSGLASTFGRGRLAREGARVVLAGKPNVGKSSLMNALLGRDRAIVSKEAGTTRDFLEESVSIGGWNAVVVDTAGIREPSVEVEREGILRSREAVSEADVVVAVLDASRPLEPADEEVLRLASSRGRWLLAANKSDLGEPAWRLDDLPGLVSGGGTASGEVLISALTGQGIEELCRLVSCALARGTATMGETPSERPAITRERHLAGLLAAQESLAEARRVIEPGGFESLEIAALLLRNASSDLEGILGSTDSEEVLDRIFASFCIGK